MILPEHQQALRDLSFKSEIDWDRDSIPTGQIPHWTTGMQANAEFFGHQSYGQKYLKTESCSPAFGDRWRAAIGSWDDKVAIDIGCDPGNLYATIGGTPQVLGVYQSRRTRAGNANRLYPFVGRHSPPTPS